eukprot:8825358-Alexandrium_andersonii.AAC.1
MSASLVGSEMCIRDSGVTPGPISTVTPATSFKQTSVGLSSLREEVPVSYTHLTLPTICSV